VILTSGRATARFADFLYDLSQQSPMTADVTPPSSYNGVYQERRRQAGHALYQSLSIDRSDHGARQAQLRENYRFFGAPHVAVITAPASLGPYALVDCGAYISSLLTVLESRGLASIAQAAIAMYSPQVRAHFEIPADRLVVAAVSIGHPDTEHPANRFRTDREHIGNVIEWRDA